MKQSLVPWLGVVVIALLIISGLNPHDRSTWYMEVAPIFLGAPFVIWSWRRYRLTTLLYVLLALHAIVLLVGGAYTYAKVPFGFWIQDVLHLARNPYDRIGHFAQGFVPTMVAREIFIRNKVVRTRGWTNFLALTVALSVSLVYELVEWGAAVALGQGADAFLGTQGDVWDTQSDMGLALLGAVVAVLLFTRWHDRQLRELEGLPPG